MVDVSQCRHCKDWVEAGGLALHIEWCRQAQLELDDLRAEADWPGDGESADG